MNMFAVPAITQGSFKARFGYLSSPQTYIPQANLLSDISRDSFESTAPLKKPSNAVAQENPALLVNYFMQVAQNTKKDEKPAVQLTVEDARIMLPYFLERGHFPKSALQYCFSDIANKNINLILNPENPKGHSYIPALLNALDTLQRKSTEFKLLSKTWGKEGEFDYNPLIKAFMYLNYPVDLHEGISEFVEHSSQTTPPFWGSYSFD